MSSGPWPNEPDEPNHEPEEFDPLTDIGPDVPSVDIPDPTDPDTEVSGELMETFWKLVAIFNVAIFALALGPMLMYFRGEVVNGGAVFLVGLVFFGHGYRKYRAYVDD